MASLLRLRAIKKGHRILRLCSFKDTPPPTSHVKSKEPEKGEHKEQTALCPLDSDQKETSGQGENLKEVF
jgi:hypothetical protein